MIVMYDSITVGTVPGNPQAVAGYVSGNWPDAAALFAAFPKAHHLSIAPQAYMNADCLDVEAGDATPGQAPGWVDRQLARGVWRPCVYASRSTWDQSLSGLLARYGRTGIRRWVAEWTFQPHIPGGYDACQWTDRAFGRNLDESLCDDSFFQAAKPTVVRGSGVAVATIELDLASLSWRVTGQKGRRVKWEQGDSRFATVEIDFGLGGSVAGRWNHRSLPFKMG